MRALLVEDDTKTSRFIREGLESAGWQVVHATNGRKGLEKAALHHVDVIIADIMMPQMDGLTMISKLRESGNPVPVIILSAKKEIDDRVRGLQEGGDDYLVKPFAMAELEARMKALLRRGHDVDERFLSCGDLELDTKEQTVRRGAETIILQPKEYALLEYLMRRQGKVVTRRMIMENVWDYRFEPQTNVVDARMCKLREKIEREFGGKIIHTIRGAGYTIQPTEEH